MRHDDGVVDLDDLDVGGGSASAPSSEGGSGTSWGSTPWSVEDPSTGARRSGAHTSSGDQGASSGEGPSPHRVERPDTAPAAHLRGWLRAVGGRRRRWAAGVVVTVLVVGAGVVAHGSGDTAAQATGDRSPRSVPWTTLDPAADHAAVVSVLRGQVPGRSLAWSPVVVAARDDAGAPLDLQRTAAVRRPVLGGDVDPSAAPAVAYRAVIGAPSSRGRDTACLVVTVKIPAWQFDQGGDASLECRAQGPAWAVREGVAPSGEGTVVVREVVVLSDDGVAASVASWSVGVGVGVGAEQLLDVATLHRAAEALARA